VVTPLDYAAVSFDLGQTLLELDPESLERKLARRGYAIQLSQVDQALVSGWAAYNRVKREGSSGYAAWRELLGVLLRSAELRESSTRRAPTDQALSALIAELFAEQQSDNLWRRPLPGVVPLLERLAEQGVPMGVLTNSEGGAAELLELVGLSRFFRVVVDSGREGIEKPDRQLFLRFAERIGEMPHRIVHVGDSFEADVRGALGAGMIPIWFGTQPGVLVPPRVHGAFDVAELSQLLGV